MLTFEPAINQMITESFISHISDEIFSVTTQMQQEEIEHVEEVEQQSGQIQSTTVCLDEATIIEQDVDEEEIEEELEQELEQEEEDDGVFTLELSEASDCEDKEYLGENHLNIILCYLCHRFDSLFILSFVIAEFVSAQTSCPYPGLFVCNLCRKEFKHSKWLQTHMKSHSNWIKVTIDISCRIWFFSISFYFNNK